MINSTMDLPDQASEGAIANIKKHFVKPCEDKEAIAELISLFKEEGPLDLSETEKKYLSSSFPILWGSTTLSKDKIKAFRSDITDEKTVKGPLRLGENIDVVFTKQKDIQKMQDWLVKNKLDDSVTVMSFGAAFYLQARTYAEI